MMGPKTVSSSPACVPLADIRNVSVDPKLPQEERLAEYLRQIKFHLTNQYIFDCA